jgi:hypothetical protein
LFMRHSFRRNNKAVSTIFGMVFFLLIVVIVFASFAVVLNQSVNLENTMMQSRQLDIEKAREALVLKSVAPDGTFWINNTGTISAQVVRLWASDADGGNPQSLQILPSKQVIGANQELSFGPMAGAYSRFRCWFVTARGNEFSFLMQGSKGQEGEPGTNGIDGKNGADGIATSSLVAQGIGSIEMNFSTFRVYTVTGSSSPWTATGYNRNGMGGSPGYSTTSGTNIAFSVNITNRDPYQRTITLRSNSVFWVIFPTQPTQVRCAYWYIVNVNPNNGQITNAAFTNIPLAINQTATVTFASSKDTGTINNFGKQSSGYSGPAAAFLMLGGTFSTGDPFGQNLPFVTVAFS